MAKRRGRKVGTTATTAGEGSISIELPQVKISTPEKVKLADLQTLAKEESMLNEEIELVEELTKETVTTQEVLEEGQRKRLWSDLFRNNREGEGGLTLKKVEEVGDEVLITKEDIEPEVKFWQYSLIAYLVGQNIPVNVMVGFLKFRWRGLVMPQVIKHEDGYFILRFEKQVDMDNALAKGNQFFYSKPVIMRKWIEGIPRPEELKVVPIWIQLPKLPLGFWGGSTLSKIVSKIGEPIRTDELTARKLKIEYARVLVNVELGKNLPDKVTIKSEKEGYSFTQDIKYEWMPIMCKTCRKWGHREEKCIKPGVKQWQVKKRVEEEGKKGADSQIVIGKETVPLLTQKNRGDVDKRDKGKGKEVVKEKEEARGKETQGLGSVEELMMSLEQKQSKGKGTEVGEPSKPPDI